MLETPQTDKKNWYIAEVPKPSRRFRTKQEMKRPKRSNTVDLQKVRAWSEIGCTRDEIAIMLDVSPSWLDEHINKDYGLERAIVDGFNDFKQSLRRTQAKLALSGHPGMLIWLGKQFLGQSDKQEMKQETTVNVVLQRAMQELRDIDAETIVEMKKLIEAKPVDGQ